MHRSPATLDPPLLSYEDAANACAELYRPFGRFAHGYVRGKLLRDPLYRQLAELAPLPLPVVDLGCGRGQTEALLEVLFPGGSYLGFDWDERKLSMARDCLGQLRTTRSHAFQAGDLRELEIPRAGSILLLDVLHYLALAEQDALLERAVEALEPGGRLCLRDVDANGGWRARVNVWQEQVGCWFGLNRGATLCFRPIDELARHLEALGLETKRTESRRGTPLANVLIEGVKAR